MVEQAQQEANMATELTRSEPGPSAATGDALGMPSAAMVVYDSRLPQSRELLGQNSWRAVDVADEHATLRS